MSSMRRGVVIAMLCVAQIVSAQIRIIPQAQLEKANPQAKSSILQFVPREVNFGTIEEMSGIWQGSAELVNRGADTIAITQIKSSCGCLKAEMQKRVLAPRESLGVVLKYYPRGHAGRVSQRVFVYTNGETDNPSAILQLRGEVTASADRSDDYPYTRGTLRLRQQEARFVGDRKEQYRIACMNGGSVVLRPTVDTMFLPKGVKVCFEPSELAPNEEGNMIVDYTPVGENGKSPLQIYIKGLGVPPRYSTIDIKFEK